MYTEKTCVREPVILMTRKHEAPLWSDILLEKIMRNVQECAGKLNPFQTCFFFWCHSPVRCGKNSESEERNDAVVQFKPCFFSRFQTAFKSFGQQMPTVLLHRANGPV